MATQSIQLLLVDGKEVRQELPLVKGNKGNKGKAPTIKATPDGKFILADKETGLAPENITVRRVGKNLHVFLEGEPFEHPTVIIEDFFEYNCELVGMAEGGAYYPYVSSNGDDDFAGALALQDGESSALVLGGDMAAGDVDRTAFGLLPWIVGGALGAGAGVGAINSNSSGGSKSAPAPSAPAPIAPAPVLKHALDNEGSIQGVILSGGKTDDTTPTFAGTGQKPGNTISIYDNGKKIGETKVAEDGSWSFTPEKPLTEGKHSITFVERGADGRDSEVSKPFEFTVDTTAPEASPIGGILDDVGVKTGQLKPGESTDDQRPTLSGKTEGNAVVEIYDNGKKIGETRADAEGNWSFTPKEPLEEGEHSLTTRVIDEAGNVSDPSDSWDLVIDITPPVLPDNPISEILDNQGGIQGPIGENGHTDDNTPTIKGKGEPGDTVIILDNGEELDRVVIGPDGEWEYTPDPALEDGDHEISVIIEDPAGNQSEESPPWVINIDTQAPSAPSIGSVLDDIGTKTGELASGDLTDDSAPTFSGTAEAGATVVIYDNDVEIDRVTADKDGNWTYTPDPALAEGEHSITVRAIDAAGNMSLPSEVFELVIDTTPPVLPENPIGEILDNHGDIQGPIGEDGHTDDNTPTFKGKGEPGDTVIILDNGEEIGRVVVGPDLIWEFTPETELADGDHEISVIIEDPAGNQSEESPPRVIHVDTQAPDSPTIGKVEDNVGTKTDDLTSGDVTDDSTPTFSGKAEAGATVVIYDNDVEIDRVTSDKDGNWTYTPDPALAEGEHSITVRAVDAAGNVSDPSAIFELVIDTTAPVDPKNDGEGPGISEILDDHGAIQGPIDNGGLTDDNTPTIKGKGEPGDTIIILDNGEELDRVVVGPEGTWEYTPEAELADGEHAITVIIEDPAGNQSKESPEWVINIDATAPDAPTIDKVVDDAGTKTGDLTSGDITDDSTPTFSGKAEPNTTVVIYDNDKEIGRELVNEKGDWTFTPSKPLVGGDHSITVQAVDAAGNTSEHSEPAFEFTLIPPSQPVAPAITSVMDDVGTIQGPLQKNDVTDDARPTLSGTSAPGVSISVYSNGNLVGTTTANDQGQWTCTPDKDLTEGLNNLTVTATDLAGNIVPGSETGVYPLVLDITRPTAIDPDDLELLDDVGAIQGPINSGDTTDDAQPTFKGKSDEPFATVVIYDNGKEIARTETDAEGNWTFTPNPALDNGEHSLSVELIDRAGNVGDRSEPIDFTVDTRLVEVSIDSILDNHGVKQGPILKSGVTDDADPLLSGRATPDSIVVIYDNGEELIRTTSDANGNWSVTSPKLSEGDHALSASVITVAGGESARSPEFDFRLDLTKPDIDVHGIKEVIDDVGTVQGQIENGGFTDDTTPTLNGTGELGDTIHIYGNDDVLLDSVKVKPDGTWSYTTPPLEQGEHAFTVVIEDEAGNQSEKSAPWIINIDTTAPDAPTIDKVVDDAGTRTGDLTSGDVTDDTTPTLSGMAEKGATVVIYVNDVEIDRVTADPVTGAWAYTPTEENKLEEGEHRINVRAIDTAGNVSDPSETFELVIDTTAPVDPGIDPDGPGIGEVYDDHGDIQGPIDNGGLTDDATPTIKGKGEPGDTVIILDNGEELGRVVVGPEGTWEFTPETELADGEHGISVIMEDPAGNQSKESPAWVINIDATAPDAPTIGKVMDNEGEVGEVIHGGVTDDSTPTFSGQAEKGATVIIYDKGVEIGRETADPVSGEWTFTPNPKLDEGAHSITVKAMDAAGNISEESPAFEFELIPAEEVVPSAPVIESVYDDAGDVTGELSPGDVTDDKRPVFSGQSDPFATVIIYNDDGVEIARGQADKDGRWTAEPTTDLIDGVYNFTAVAESAAGTSSEPSEPFEVILYTGNGPHQVARLSHMGKDSGQDGQDFVTDNGSFGRLMHGVLSAELAAGQSLQVSTDGGKTWFDALVKGTDWAAQDLNAHTDDWTIQTRVVGTDGKTGFVMEQQVVLDTTASRAPSSIQIEGSNLLVAFDPSDVAVGDRIAVIADGGAQRFEYTLTEVDIIAGSVSLEVGAISSASAALVDQAGNLSGYANTGSNPSVNSVLTGDVSEVYGTTKDNVFTIGDVSVLQDIKVIEGNAGVDTLKLAGANQVLDLSAWQGRLSSIEVIDITGSGDNTLKVSLGDVLDLGHLGFFHGDPTVQLAVKGDAGDTVILNNLLPNGMDVGEWENLGTVEPAGITYEVYRNEALAVDILVQEGVTVQF